MARTVPATYTAPEPGLYAPEEIVSEATSDGSPEALAMAAQYLAALNLPVVDQGWNDGDNPCRRSAAMPVMPAAGSYGTHVCVWRIPAYANRTSLDVAANAVRAGASGVVRFRSVTADDTVDLAIGAARGWVVGSGLTCDFTAGYEDVEMYVSGAGGSDTSVYSAHVDFPIMSSPMSAPSASDGYVPFDEAELDDDEPLSADAMERLRANVDELLTRQRVVWTWSGLVNTSAGGAAAQAMPTYPHSLIVPVHRGTTRRDRKVRVWVRSVNAGGSDLAVKVLARGRTPKMDDARIIGSVTVPAGTASAAWFSADVRLPEELDFQAVGVDHPCVRLGVVPEPSTGAKASTAPIWSMSAWCL